MDSYKKMNIQSDITQQLALMYNNPIDQYIFSLEVYNKTIDKYVRNVVDGIFADLDREIQCEVGSIKKLICDMMNIVDEKKCDIVYNSIIDKAIREVQREVYIPGENIEDFRIHTDFMGVGCVVEVAENKQLNGSGNGIGKHLSDLTWDNCNSFLKEPSLDRKGFSSNHQFKVSKAYDFTDRTSSCDGNKKGGQETKIETNTLNFVYNRNVDKFTNQVIFPSNEVTNIPDTKMSLDRVKVIQKQSIHFMNRGPCTIYDVLDEATIKNISDPIQKCITVISIYNYIFDEYVLKITNDSIDSYIISLLTPRFEEKLEEKSLQENIKIVEKSEIQPTHGKSKKKGIENGTVEERRSPPIQICEPKEERKNPGKIKNHNVVLTTNNTNSINERSIEICGNGNVLPKKVNKNRVVKVNSRKITTKKDANCTFQHLVTTDHVKSYSTNNIFIQDLFKNHTKPGRLEHVDSFINQNCNEKVDFKCFKTTHNINFNPHIKKYDFNSGKITNSIDEESSPNSTSGKSGNKIDRILTYQHLITKYGLKSRKSNEDIDTNSTNRDTVEKEKVLSSRKSIQPKSVDNNESKSSKLIRKNDTNVMRHISAEFVSKNNRKNFKKFDSKVLHRILMEKEYVQSCKKAKLIQRESIKNKNLKTYDNNTKDIGTNFTIVNTDTKSDKPTNKIDKNVPIEHTFSMSPKTNTTLSQTSTESEDIPTISIMEISGLEEKDAWKTTNRTTGGLKIKLTKCRPIHGTVKKIVKNKRHAVDIPHTISNKQEIIDTPKSAKNKKSDKKYRKKTSGHLKSSKNDKKGTSFEAKEELVQPELWEVSEFVDVESVDTPKVAKRRKVYNKRKISETKNINHNEPIKARDALPNQHELLEASDYVDVEGLDTSTVQRRKVDKKNSKKPKMKVSQKEQNKNPLGMPNIKTKTSKSNVSKAKHDLGDGKVEVFKKGEIGTFDTQKVVNRRKLDKKNKNRSKNKVHTKDPYEIVKNKSEACKSISVEAKYNLVDQPDPLAVSEKMVTQKVVKRRKDDKQYRNKHKKKVEHVKTETINDKVPSESFQTKDDLIEPLWDGIDDVDIPLGDLNEDFDVDTFLKLLELEEDIYKHMEEDNEIKVNGDFKNEPHKEDRMKKERVIEEASRENKVENVTKGETKQKNGKGNDRTDVSNQEEIEEGGGIVNIEQEAKKKKVHHEKESKENRKSRKKRLNNVPNKEGTKRKRRKLKYSTKESNKVPNEEETKQQSEEEDKLNDLLTVQDQNSNNRQKTTDIKIKNVTDANISENCDKYVENSKVNDFFRRLHYTGGYERALEIIDEYEDPTIVLLNVEQESDFKFNN